MNALTKEDDVMGLLKVSGLPQTDAQDRDYRQSTDPPEVLIYNPALVAFKHYALQLLALTGLTDEEAIQKVLAAAEKIETPEDQNWTQWDAQAILAAVGTPPVPSHVVVRRVPGHAMLLMRAAGPETKKARALRYNKSRRAGISVLSELRAEGMTVPEGSCMEVPVKLAQDEEGLVLAVLLRRQRTRGLTEAEKEQKKQGEAK
jgi:hypothetical protein